MEEKTFHIPVLPKETLKFLDPKPGEIFVDATLGGGGHAEKILEKIGKNGKLIGIDCDPEAIAESQKNLSRFKDQVIFINDNFINLKNILGNLGVMGVDGILFDLGVSSYQLETPERGFSFGEKGMDAPLDMRMNPAQQFSAYDIVNFYPEKKLREIFFKLGEEPFGGKIAREIIKVRDRKKIETCGELLDLIRRATPPDYRFSRKGHWASKIFRALRMEVNQELPALEEALPQALGALKPGGRLVVISFHSLEDRIVKHQFLEWQKSGLVEILTKKPVMATPEEIAQNPRADSAKLRAVKKNWSIRV
ncbi:MAG: 16S rRNA (cytosine(1402)-N(4))-methyltransferase RsmH [Patescibacteria group bacterium]